LRAFPADICRRWLIHTKKEGVPENEITKFVEVLNEHLEGASNGQKKIGDSSLAFAYTSTTIIL
jgi:hypothetical protein